MKILLDLGHPKYVYALKNSIAELRLKGHEFLVFARDKECVQPLCKAFGIPFHDRGRGGGGILGRLTYLAKSIFTSRSLVRNFHPDLLASFGSPILALIGVMKGIPVVVFDDHEPNRAVQAIYVPTSKAIVVPSCFQKTLSRKQLRFNSYFELAYLHPNQFRPATGISRDLGLAHGQPYVLLRFVSWKAFHDRGQHGMDLEAKRRLVAVLTSRARVFISSEGELPPDLEASRFPLPPERLHDALAGAALYAGDSTTMAAEAAVLGVPSLHMSDVRTGYVSELQDTYKLLESFPPTPAGMAQMIVRGNELLQSADARSEWQVRRKRMLEDKFDTAAFMTWFLDQFPESVRVMQKDPGLSRKFPCRRQNFNRK